MEKLTKREEQIMQAVWKLDRAFIREILEEHPEPKPHYNSVATIVKILVKKGFLKSVLISNTHQYSPKISLEDYREEHISDIKKKYFGNSFTSMLSHFAKKEKMTDEEKEELINIIKSGKTK